LEVPLYSVRITKGLVPNTHRVRDLAPSTNTGT